MAFHRHKAPWTKHKNHDDRDHRGTGSPPVRGRRGGDRGRGRALSPDAALLDELVRRIVESVHPLQITQFGSAARGEMGPHSDLDVLLAALLLDAEIALLLFPLGLLAFVVGLKRFTGPKRFDFQP